MRRKGWRWGSSKPCWRIGAPRSEFGKKTTKSVKKENLLCGWQSTIHKPSETQVNRRSLGFPPPHVGVGQGGVQSGSAHTTHGRALNERGAPAWDEGTGVTEKLYNGFPTSSFFKSRTSNIFLSWNQVVIKNIMHCIVCKIWNKNQT